MREGAEPALGRRKEKKMKKQQEGKDMDRQMVDEPHCDILRALMI